MRMAAMLLNTLIGACMGILSPIIQPALSLYYRSKADTPQEKRLWPNIIIQVADIYVLYAIFNFLTTPSSLVSVSLANSGLAYVVLGLPCLLGSLHGAAKGYALKCDDTRIHLLENIWKWQPKIIFSGVARPILRASAARRSLWSAINSMLMGAALGPVLAISMPIVQSIRRIKEANYPILQYLSDTINIYASTKALFIIISLLQTKPLALFIFPTALGTYGLFRGGYLGYHLNLALTQKNLIFFANHILEGGLQMREAPALNLIDQAPALSPAHEVTPVMNNHDVIEIELTPTPSKNGIFYLAPQITIGAKAKEDRGHKNSNMYSYKF